MWRALLAVLLAAPQGSKLQFRHHFIDRTLPGTAYGQTALADVDGDGDLDFITGRRAGDILWFEYRAPDDWKRHLLGKDSPSDVGGNVLDVDRDGKIDFVAGGAWYRHGAGEPWERRVFDKDLASVHDFVTADLDGDRRPDVITMSDKNNLRWYRIPDDPTRPWERRDIGPSVHAGVCTGDLDGDGDLDVVRSNIWFENVDGKGLRWAERANIPFGNPNNPFPYATRSAARDLDGDGDLDLVMTTNEIRNPKIAWLENADGKGGAWKVHELVAGDAAVRGAYHSLAVEDFDGDRDWDVFTCEMEGIAGDRPPRWFMWENVEGRFVERVILDAGLGGHEAVVGDVDGDGDLDVCAKLWAPRKDNANGGRMHADYLENLWRRKP